MKAIARRRFGLIAAALLAAIPARAAEKPIKLVLNVGLQVLDPIAGPSFVTRNFAYMVFDTLVAMDSKGDYKPQMLESWTSSDDKLTWTFTLRPKLVFSDGAPVTAEDCVASLKRWGDRDNIGRRLMAATKSLTATGADTFVLQLARPFGGVIAALGKPSVQVPFIMPARIASVTPATTPVKEIVGSGPFLFVKEEWVPGERTVFRRNPAYVPRDEPADGLAGGKVARAEQVEFVNMADPGLRAAALQNNEVDYLEYAPTDYLAKFRADKNLVLSKAGGIAQIMGAISINQRQPAIRQCAGAPSAAGGIGAHRDAGRVRAAGGYAQAGLRVDVHVRHAVLDRGRRRDHRHSVDRQGEGAAGGVRL